MSEEVTLWIEKLNSQESSVRRAAVLAIRRIGEPALDSLLQALIDGSVSPHYLADALRQFENQAIDLLVDILRDSPDEVQARVAIVLGLLEDNRSLTALIMALGDENEQVRANVAEALGSFSDPIAVGPLINTLETDEPPVRTKAAISLAPYHQEEGVIEALLVSINDEDMNVRIATIQAMAQVDDKRVRAALKDHAHNDTDGEVRQLAVAAMRHLDGDPLAFKRLNANKNITQSMQAVIDSIAENEELDTQAMDAIRASNPRIRARVIEALGDKGGLLAVNSILPGLSDINPAVRATAIQALAKMGDSAVEPLLEKLDNPSQYVRSGIIEVFGRLQDPRTLDVVIQQLKSDEAMLRTAGIIALSKWGDDEKIVPLLRNALKDIDETVRETAEQALNQRGVDPSQFTNPINRLFGRFFKR